MCIRDRWSDKEISSPAAGGSALERNAPPLHTLWKGCLLYTSTGKKVLLIDGDPQGSLTISLGHPQPDKLPFTLSDAMGRILMDEPMRPGEGILHHPEGVDLMPADIQLSGMEVSLVNAMSRETILRQYLDTLKGQYSHILIDCQPSLGMLTVNALAAANLSLIHIYKRQIRSCF